MYPRFPPRQDSLETWEALSLDGQRAVELGEADHLGLGLMRAVPFPLGRVEQRPLGVNFFSLLPFAGKNVGPLVGKGMRVRRDDCSRLRTSAAPSPHRSPRPCATTSTPRRRTGRAAKACRPLGQYTGTLLVFHRVGQLADALDLDRDFIAILEQHRRSAGEADAVRGAGEDHRAGDKLGAAAEELDQRRHVENHVFGVPVLHHLAVEDGLDAERVRVGNLVARHQHRAKRTECVERFTAAPLAAAAALLPVARTDVVGAGIAKHIVKRVGLRDIFTVSCR